MNEAVSPGALSTLFTDARTHNGWRETPVSDETLREIYALMKWGPTSANCSPHVSLIRTAEGKERLRPALSSGTCKTLTAPVTAIVAWDSEFYERLPHRFLTAMPAVGLPPAHNLPKKQRFATVPCRRPILSSLAVRWDWIPARCRFNRQHVDDVFCGQHAEEQSAD